MPKKNNKGITLDELANMIAKGFEGADKKFDSIDQDLAGIKQGLADVKHRLGKVEFQVDEVYDILKRFEENDILNLQKRVQILEKAVRALAAGRSPK